MGTDQLQNSCLLLCILQTLSNFTEKNNLSKLIREQLGTVTSSVEGLINAIPNIIEADRILIEKLQEQRINSQVRRTRLHGTQSISQQANAKHAFPRKFFDVDVACMLCEQSHSQQCISCCLLRGSLRPV